jgi:hypothetical protein
MSRPASLLTKPPDGIKFSDHEGGDGEAFRRAAYRHGLEGLVSKRLDRVHWVRPELVVEITYSRGRRTASFATPSSSVCAKANQPAK